MNDATDPSAVHDFVVGEDDEGQRLDRWLVDQDVGVTRSRLQKLIESEHVQVDGEPAVSRLKLKTGQRVRVTIPPATPVRLDPDPSIAFVVVYEDEDLAVIDKPAHLVVHPAPGHREGTLIHGLMARLSNLSGVGGRMRPGLVHRLDQDTTGLMVVAKNDTAHHSLADQLRERTIKRIYRAIVWGTPDPPKGRIDQPLDRDPRDRKRRAVVDGGRPAVTDFRVEMEAEGASLLRLRLKTGRTHQIRVHLAFRGHPVLGDPLYGGGAQRLTGAHPEHRAALRRALERCGRQALHACELSLQHPTSGAIMRWTSPLPADLSEAWQEIGGRAIDDGPRGPGRGTE